MFTKLDLSQVYLQLPVDTNSMKYCTIKTHHGLYGYKEDVATIKTHPCA